MYIKACSYYQYLSTCHKIMKSDHSL